MGGGRWQLMPRLEQSHTVMISKSVPPKTAAKQTMQKNIKLNQRAKAMASRWFEEKLEYQRGNQKP